LRSLWRNGSSLESVLGLNKRDQSPLEHLEPSKFTVLNYVGAVSASVFPLE
jgi:hypothetical protein